MLELNKIYNMDCIEGLKKADNDSIDLIVTDPPYYLPASSYVGARQSKYNKYSRRTLEDTSVFKTYFKLIFEELDRVIKESGTYYVFCDAQSYPVFYEVLFPYCKYVRLLVWDKLISYNGYTWRHQHELIAWGEKENSKRIPTGDGDIIKCRGVLQEDRNHPAEKPIEILEKLINKHKTAGMVVLDPYIGSGSTAVACKRLDVNYVGFELNEDYCEIAKKRLYNVPLRLEDFIFK